MPRRFTAPIPPEQGFKPELKLVWTPEFNLGTGGLVTSLPASQLNPDQARELTNFDIEDGMLVPRFGYDLTENGPDLDYVAGFIDEFELLDGSEYYPVALTKYNLWSWNWSTSTWTKETRSGGASYGASTFYPRGAMVQDVYIITRSNGVAQKFIGTGTDKISDLSADVTSGLRYVVSHADRAVLAGGVASGTKQKVQWSVSGDVTDFASTGSGSVELVNNPEDPVDEISGLTVHGDLLVIYRRNSIWIGQRTGVPTPAIAFQSRVQGLGCAAPDGVQKIGPEGDIFCNVDNVYFYSPGAQQPIAVGDPIKKELRTLWGYSEDKMATLLTTVRWSPNREFWLIHGDTILIFDVEAFLDAENPRIVWRKYDIPDGDTMTGIGWANYTGTYAANRQYAPMFCDDGKYIFHWNTYALGFGGGAASKEKFTDGGLGSGTPAGTAITCTYVSPEFHLPDANIQLSKLALTYVLDDSNAVKQPVTISTSTDGGTTWDNARTYNLQPCDENRTMEFGIREAYADTVMFKLEMTAYDWDSLNSGRPQIRLINFKLGLIPRGEKRTRNLMVHKDLKLQWDILNT